MTVVELIDSIIAAYPGASGEAMRTFKPVFFARFAKREGGHLAAAFATTLAEFKPTTRQPFPIPGDFEKHMPSVTLSQGKSRDSGPPIDLAARKRRADSLFTDWQQGQCRRADKGNPLLRRALENVARQVADVQGWKEIPEPLVLTKAQLKTACQSAISLERRERYGNPPKDKDLWWRQIRSVADEWGVRDGTGAITPEWWDKSTGDAFAAAEEPATAATAQQSNPFDPSAPLGAGKPAQPAGPRSPREQASHVALLKSRIVFFRDMGMPDYVATMERELAEIEAQQVAA